ncbi:MAG: NAD-dependent epimerase/dehydratase family protein [Proteobacteria bacterium]|nr:NAD-dependent epimerase/dehydratase family protein [Pseudomonadota bacterium]MCP4915506.1 NAD-dependent epimerase/dehydratase family protein [Pseudomonadota bacterium]
MTSKRIVITGATGFLGNHVVRKLTAQGHTIIAVSRRGTPVEGAAEVVTGDVTSREQMEAVLQGADVYIHGAGLVSFEPEDAPLLYKVHVVGTEVALAAAKAVGVKRVVYISTSGTVALSETSQMMDETSPTPRQLIQKWAYYRTKLYAEEHALAQNEDGFEVVALNPSLLLGPGDVKGESVKSVRMFLDGEIPASPPGGISFVDVRDAANAVVDALDKGEGGQRYLLAGGNMPFSAFYQRLAQVTDREPPSFRAPTMTKRFFEFLPGLGKDGVGFGFNVDRVGLLQACHYWYCDDSKARGVLGFKTRDPNTTLRDTCADILWAGGSRFAPPERVGT